jgi:hypothetical protein
MAYIAAGMALGCGETAETDVMPESEPTDDIGEASDEFTWVVKCKERGIQCMMECANEGVSCASVYPHPHRRDPDPGDLVGCVKAPKSCVYDYGGGERCWVITYKLAYCRVHGGG